MCWSAENQVWGTALLAEQVEGWLFWAGELWEIPSMMKNILPKLESKCCSVSTGHQVIESHNVLFSQVPRELQYRIVPFSKWGYLRKVCPSWEGGTFDSYCIRTIQSHAPCTVANTYSFKEFFRLGSALSNCRPRDLNWVRKNFEQSAFQYTVRLSGMTTDDSKNGKLSFSSSFCSHSAAKRHFWSALN